MEILKIKNKYDTEFELTFDSVEDVIDFIQEYTAHQELKEMAWMKNRNYGVTYDN